MTNEQITEIQASDRERMPPPPSPRHDPRGWLQGAEAEPDDKTEEEGYGHGV